MSSPATLIPTGLDAGGASGDWDVLIDLLLGKHSALAERIGDAIQLQLPAYNDVTRSTFDDEVGLQLKRVLRSARAGRPAVSDTELLELVAIGEKRARQGIPVTDMLRAWRIGIEVMVSYAREAGRRLQIADGQVLEFVQSALAWSDVAMVTTTGAHRRTELALALAEESRGAAFVRHVLFGGVGAGELRIQAEAYGLDPHGEYVAVRAALGRGVVSRKLEWQLGFHRPCERPQGMCAVVDGGIAGFLATPPPTDVDGVAGYGPPRPLDRLIESYRLAVRALMTAQAFGRRGAHDITALGLRTAVATDADLGAWLRSRYLDPLEASGSGTELVATLRAFLACGMHVERASTRLFVHQNTVRYRLARFEELTGASLHDAEALFEVWWALELAATQL